MEIGQWVRRERERRGWSIRELARASDLSHVTIRDIENGDASPTWDTLGKIARTLGLDAATAGHLLLGIEDGRDLYVVDLTPVDPPERPALKGLIDGLRDQFRQIAEARRRAQSPQREPLVKQRQGVAA